MNYLTKSRTRQLPSNSRSKGAFNEKDPNQTLGHVKNCPSEMFEIKIFYLNDQLVKFVPKGSNFKESWDKAANCLKGNKRKN
ncbi:hypothetical protein BpHYR1_003313 [Brachionus plicatilis]|uniref:Uncharacterized protein n=1 Tax=Brachionus plicatilis TaxID=10195 RepID=A0A3M7Q5N2_BRAPC|nr:hypothetical protein BpHYR1_003313 [Brachionus plicatilis]